MTSATTPATTSESDEPTLVERLDGLVVVTFNRPNRKNAVVWHNLDTLDRVLAEMMRNADDRALLITGAGGNFGSGADLSASVGDGPPMSNLTGRPSRTPVHDLRVANEILLRLYRLPKPTMAVIDGVAVGISLGIALACDLIIASDRSRFSEIFVKRGLALDGGNSWTLPTQVGVRRAKEMAMFGDMVGAQGALDWGLVNRVVPADELMSVATELGRRLATGPTTALSLIKRMLDANGSLTFEEALEDEARAQHIAFSTHDVGEGVRAFLEKREPQFTGN